MYHNQAGAVFYLHPLNAAHFNDLFNIVSSSTKLNVYQEH